MIPALQQAHQDRIARLARMGALPARRPIIIAVRPEVERAPLVEAAPEAKPPKPAAFNGMLAAARRLVADTAEDHGLSFRDLISDHRFKHIATARMEACWRIARDIPDITLSAIGRTVRKDHSTVIHAIRVFNERTGENVRGLGVVSLHRREQCRRAARVSHAEARL